MSSRTRRAVVIGGLGLAAALVALPARDIASYDIVFWIADLGDTAPSVLRSFLARHDLSGKTLIPFITHGGYGLAIASRTIRAHAPDALLVEGLAMEADQERRTVETVADWLGQLRTS